MIQTHKQKEAIKGAKIMSSSINDDDIVNALHNIGKIARLTAESKGFDLTDTPVQIALMHAELSEALEAARLPELSPDKHCPKYKSLHIELADVILRVLQYCDTNGIPIGGAILAKLRYNLTRPFKHGSKKY